MQIAHIEGATRVIGKSQGYLGLPVKDHKIAVSVGGIVREQTSAMTTAWHPTPAELELLNAGASIHVTLLGSQHPPIMLDIGPVPGAE